MIFVAVLLLAAFELYGLTERELCLYLSVDFEIQFHKICELPTQLGRILHSRNGVKEYWRVCLTDLEPPRK